jgi:hypothetical protein
MEGIIKKKMKKVNSFVVQIATASIFLIFLLGSANAGCIGDETGANFGCGDTIDESCAFNESLSCNSGHGLIIGANGITIDGNGYTLDGVSSGACDGLGIQRSGIYNKAHDDVLIKNLKVKNFCNGIYCRYDDEAGDKVENVTIENCGIHHNGGDSGGDNSVHGIKAIGVFDSEIKNCKIHDNTGKGDSCEGGGNGIFLKGISGYGAWGNIITHNEIYDNKKGGFFTKMMCKDTEVGHNKLWGNGQGGIILRCMKSETHDIHHNNASANYGSGIFVGGPDNVVRYNIASNNKNGSEYGGGGAGQGSGSPGKYGMGICMGRSDGSFNNEIISNEVCGNEGVDIESFSATAGNTGDENTCNSCYNYNDNGTTCCTYACPGVVDLTIINKSESWVDTQNKTYDVTYTIKNTGNSTAGESTTGIYIDDTLLATAPSGVIGPGESCTRTVGPFTMSGGNDTIRVRADNENVIEENNETNNCIENEFEYPGVSAGFDAGAPSNPYPSIFGTHNGTIIPDQDITVNRMYTYPCEGTGGHSEYAMIWNESGTIAETYWNGYISDYHNITFNMTFTLFAGCTYNYTIRTGSYPQIIHAREYEAKEGGNIACTVFIDANGKTYDDWIPAIRLWKE